MECIVDSQLGSDTELASLQRIVVKVGSSSLTDDTGRLSITRIHDLVAQLATIQRSGEWQVLLVSSGAVAAGLAKLGWHRSSITMPEKQAAAAVGQGLLMKTYERLFQDEDITIAQLLLTRDDIEDRKRFIHIRNTMMSLLRHGIVPIVNENDTVAVDEIRIGDNDTLASLVALVAEANRLVLLTDIDGLYTSNPKYDANAKRIRDIWQVTDEVLGMAGEAGSAAGTGGMRTKLAAAKIAVDSGTDMMIASSSEPDVLLKIIKGIPIGTTFHAPRTVGPRKKSWLVHGTRCEGRLVVDSGAALALSERAGSLLLPGIVEVVGDFQEGAVVELSRDDAFQRTNGQTAGGEAQEECPDALVGRGIVSFSASDLKMLLLRKQAGEKLHNLHEVVHRNDLVLYAGGRGYNAGG